MLQMPIIFVFLLSGLMPSLSGPRAQQPESSMVRAQAHVVDQKYCRGDADLFTVSLKLKLEAVNSSKTTVFLIWPMVPWIGKVATSIGDAEGGRFLYELTASHYPLDVTRFKRLKIEPSKKVTVQTGYDLVARHDPTFSYPKSVSAGSYAVVLVLRPEEEPPTQLEGPDTLRNITTEPFVVEVPATPELVSCQSGPKPR